jgi:hypothetical protein
MMKPITKVEYFATKEERREFIKNLDTKRYTLFCQGKVAPKNAPGGRQYKVILFPTKWKHRKEVQSEGRNRSHL